MKKHRGISFVEALVVVLVVALIVALIYANYREAVYAERRAIAQQALMTGVSLQERWYLRLYEYARDIRQLGGERAAGEHYLLSVTQNPCGDTSCFTLLATAVGKQLDDKTCQKMSVNHLGQRWSVDHRNRDTTAKCWD